jgi:serine carboxypeptidase-like clade I
MLLPPRYLPNYPGFIQEIGPYYLEDGKNYQAGDNLT